MRTSPATRSFPPTRRAGFTLLELMTVLAILAFVAGMSVGVYREVAIRNILPAAASQVSSVIRAARNFSISSGLPSRVAIDREEGTIAAFGFELVASWSFEDLEAYEIGQELPRGTALSGAFREAAETQGVIEVGDGRIGRCLVLLDEGASAVAERRPRYDSPRGFSLEAWVRFWPPTLEAGAGNDRSGAWSDPRRGQRYAVVSRPGSYEMGLLGDGAVYVVIGDPDRPDAFESFSAATASGAVLGSRWTHIRVSFDSLELSLEADGIDREWAPEGFERVDPRDWPPLPARVPVADGDLMISHPNRFFIGGIDEVKVRVALEPLSYVLPSEVVFVDPSRWVRFDSRGSLDPVYHDSPVLVRVGELGDDAQVEEGPGGTAVGPTSLEEREMLATEREEEALEDALGDPVAALSRYLEEQTRLAEEESAREMTEDPDRVRAGEGEASEEIRARGIDRLHRIIIDLTGTIRG